MPAIFIGHDPYHQMIPSVVVTGGGSVRIRAFIRRPFGAKKPRGMSVPARFLKADEGASPVIGTMIMVALTIIYSALILAIGYKIATGEWHP